MDKKDLDRFTDILEYYRIQSPPSRFSFRKRPGLEQKTTQIPLVNIVSYLMMPDHFHLLLEQPNPEGVSRFMALVTNSYTKYFNARHKRSGPLFKGIFKRKEINKSSQIVEVASFIHLEPLRKGIVSDIKRFPFSSFPEYMGSRVGFCSKDSIMKNFSSQDDYLTYLLQPHIFIEKEFFLE